MKRTDLICENAVINNKSETSYVHDFNIKGTKITEVRINDNTIKGCSKGLYYTIYCDEGDVKGCVTEILKNMFPSGNALVVGLGNEAVCSDSIGPKSLAYIPATAHLSAHEDFSALGIRPVYVFDADVTGKTGIESSEHINVVASSVNADFIVAIDSLACSDFHRLCRTIQITDTGISPGSGVGNNRKPLNEATCGVPVYAIGVPTVIDLKSVCCTEENLMVTPRNIDKLTASFARIIGKSVSKALNYGLSEDELSMLIL